MKKKNSIIISSIIFLILILSTYLIIFHKYNFNVIYNNMKLIPFTYIIIAFLLVILYFLCQALYFKIIFKCEKVDITLKKGIFYSIVEFFFSAITPSSTGGQPIQLYYMTKDKIPMRKSIIALILNTIIFKIFFVVGGICILIFYPEFIFNNGYVVNVLFWLGMLIDISLVVGCLLLMYNQKIVSVILKFFFKIKNKILKRKENNDEQINEILEKYIDEAKFIKDNTSSVLIANIITFIQRILLFSITFVVYKSFGLNQMSYLKILLLQIFVQITCEGIILPGGVGASEFISNYLFISIFGLFSTSAMIICRTLSFYIPLIILLLIIIIVTKKYYFKKDKKLHKD